MTAILVYSQQIRQSNYWYFSIYIYFILAISLLHYPVFVLFEPGGHGECLLHLCGLAEEKKKAILFQLFRL